MDANTPIIMGKAIASVRASNKTNNKATTELTDPTMLKQSINETSVLKP